MCRIYLKAITNCHRKDLSNTRKIITFKNSNNTINISKLSRGTFTQIRKMIRPLTANQILQPRILKSEQVRKFTKKATATCYGLSVTKNAL